MRSLVLSVAAAVSAVILPHSAGAADLVEVRGRAPITYPVCTEEGYCNLGIVEVWPGPAVPRQWSPITGQPLPVVYNNPTTVYGAVDPGLVLMHLPRHRHRIRYDGLYGAGG